MYLKKIKNKIKNETRHTVLQCLLKFTIDFCKIPNISTLVKNALENALMLPVRGMSEVSETEMSPFSMAVVLDAKSVACVGMVGRVGLSSFVVQVVLEVLGLVSVVVAEVVVYAAKKMHQDLNAENTP